MIGRIFYFEQILCIRRSDTMHSSKYTVRTNSRLLRDRYLSKVLHVHQSRTRKHWRKRCQSRMIISNILRN